MRDTIDMAREAGFNLEQGFLLRVTGIDEDLKRFEALVRADEREETNSRANASWALMCEKMVAAEREACAKVCDSYVDSSSDHEAGTAMNIQDAIRARGNT